MTATVLCCRCANNEVPAPKNIEEDPICEQCKLEMYPAAQVYEFNNDEGGCQGFEDSCPNMAEGDDDFCLDCHRKMAESLEAQEGTTFFASLATPLCPGYGTGEDCGNPKLPGGDLCGDCHMARCDAESPRIPH